MLAGMGVAMLVGYASFPLLRFNEPNEIVITVDPAAEKTLEASELDSYAPPEGVVIDFTGGTTNFASDEEAETALATWGTEEEETVVMPTDDPSYDINSFEPDDTIVQEIASAEEIEDIPLDPKQDRISALIPKSRHTSVMTKTRILARLIEKERDPERGLKQTDTFTDQDWMDPAQLKKTVADRMLSRLGGLTQQDIWKFMQSPKNRQDLAVYQLITLATPAELTKLTKSMEGVTTLRLLSNDLVWMEGLLYSGPTNNFPVALRNLVSVFSGRNELINDAVARRLGTTGALEFAREGWDSKLLVDRFNFYYDSYDQGLLNTIFDDLEYWETRFLMGATQPSAWGSVKNLTWLRDNVRLPVEGYTGAAYQVPYRLRNVAGDSIHGPDYLAAFMKYYDGIVALAHREVGGVCGALSHYGTFAALANGIPAATMGEPGHCAYTIRVGNEWSRANSIYWQHSLHKTMWGEHSWDFLILTQALYSNVGQTMVSDQLAALGDFLTSYRKKHGAFLCYEDAVLAQPNNWPVLLKYAAFLRDKAPKNLPKWKELSELVNDGLNQQFHNASATLLSKYVYPHLTPLVTNKNDLARIFSAFFKECKTMGTNRWDVNGILSRQLTSFEKTDDQIFFMKMALRELVRNPDYVGASIAWALSYVDKLPENEQTASLKEEFTEVVVAALNRASASKRHKDAAWNAMNVALRQAVENGDRGMFQTIAKLTNRRYKKNFPKNKFRFRGFPGSLLSTTALIKGDRQMDNNEVVALHWAALQKEGGSMQMKSEITVEMEQRSSITGVVCISKANEQNSSRPLTIEYSEDGQNWSAPIKGVAEGQVVRFDFNKVVNTARFVRLKREGKLQASDFHGQAILGFYVYGKKIRM